MRKTVTAIIVCSLIGLTGTARANLVGDNIQGVLNWGGYGTTNFFDPVNGFVPAGSSGIQPNAVVADPDPAYVELMYLNGFSGLDVDVDAATVAITCFPVGQPGGLNDWDVWLNDLDSPEGWLTSVVKTSDAFPGGVTVSFTGDSIHITSPPGGWQLSGPTTATLDLEFVPEPSTLVLLSLGAVGAFRAWRRRRV